MNTNLPHLLIRSTAKKESIAIGSKYSFTSATHHHKSLLNGAHVILDSKTREGIEILGHGTLGPAEQIGIYQHTGRQGNHYSSTFIDWAPCSKTCLIEKSIYDKLLFTFDVSNTKKIVRPISLTSFDKMISFTNDPVKIGDYFRKLLSAQSDYGIGEILGKRKKFSVRSAACRAPAGEDWVGIYEEQVDSYIVPVFYATDRKFDNRTNMASIYSSERDNDIHFGIAEVSIPKSHQVGQIETPSIWKLFKRRDPAQYIILTDVKWFDETTFLHSIAAKIGASTAKDAFVFIHGYNVTFENAALRTAQITFDLKFKGAPIMYSWPSKGVTAAYAADEATVEWTAHHLKYVLERIAVETKAELIHVIAHSMGNRALANALLDIDVTDIRKVPVFNQIVLTAPDIDSGVFETLAYKISQAANRVTLYASSNDHAIQLSQKWHDFPRIGQTKPEITIVPGIDTIDASEVDTGLFSLGHSYPSTSRSVLADVYDLIHKQDPPDNRFQLIRRNIGDLIYWAFKP